MIWPQAEQTGQVLAMVKGMAYQEMGNTGRGHRHLSNTPENK